MRALALASSACVPAPDFSDRVSEEIRAAPYPRILPTGPLLARAGAGPAQTGDAAALRARAARLQARAAALRGPVIPAAERQRMAAARARLAR